ncbi:hypothetical protein [Blastococcus sp. SYSU DS0619]
MTAVHSPWPADPPVDHPVGRPWATRAELLAARADAVPRIERRLLSLRRIGRHLLLAVVIVWCGALVGFSGQDQDGGAVVVVLAVLALLAAVAASVSLVRGERENRRAMDLLEAWEAAERAGRALPRGPVRPEHRMPFDAQDDEDFHEVVERTWVQAAIRRRSMRLRVYAVVIGMGLVVGFTGMLMLTLAGEHPTFVVTGTLGAVPFFTFLVSGVRATRFAFRVDRISRRLDRDVAELPRYVPRPKPSFVMRVLVPAVVSAPFTVLLIHLVLSWD